MQQLHEKIDRLMSMPPYDQSPGETQAALLELLKEELDYACQRHAGYKRYVDHWPVNYQSAGGSLTSHTCRWAFSRPIPRCPSWARTK